MLLRQTALLLTTALIAASVILFGGALGPTGTADAAKGGGKPGGGSSQSDPRLVYINNKSGAIEVANLDGSARAVVLPAAGGYVRPNWSPLGDGSESAPYRIVYELPICAPWLNVLDLVIVDGATTAKGDPSQISTGGQPACAPEYSRDGTKLIFGEGFTENPSTNPSSLWIMDATGLNPPIAVYDAPTDWSITYASISPNGDRIAFVESGPGPAYANRITIVNTGDLSYNVVLDESRGYGPRYLEWSPSSNELAFTSPWDSLGPGDHIFIMNLDALPAGPQPLPVSGSTWRPSWCAGTLNQLVFSNHNGVSVYDFTTGQSKLVVRGGGAAKCRKVPL